MKYIRYNSLFLISILLLGLGFQYAAGQSSERKDDPSKQAVVNPLSPQALGEEKYQEMKAKGLIPQTEQSVFTKEHERRNTPFNVRTPYPTPQLLVPLDGTFTLAMPKCDDCSSGLINLPFAFNLYGTCYTGLYINNNGNITFTSSSSTFTPGGFPSTGLNRVAPFWADVQTSPAAGGQVWYRIDPNRIIVIWDRVGYYSSHTDKLNTFQAILTDGTDALIGLGKNLAFSYDDMQWTTGDASGGSGGFGGVPATVGANAGDGVNFTLVGRFDHEGTDYDGAGGANDGVSYLDGKNLFFDVSAAGGLATITGVKYNDMNGNGTRDIGEPGLAGWTINISGPVNASAVTSSGGVYSFTSLPAGTYTISEVPQVGWTQTEPSLVGSYTVVITTGVCVTRNFGNWRPVSIRGKKFFDLNGNGADDNEPGLANWTINLIGPVNRTTMTNEQGNYFFTNIPPGEYVVSEAQQGAWVQTYPAFGEYDLDLEAGDNATDIDFGNRLFQQSGRGAISGTVFNDANGNGLRDSGEPPLSGWRVELHGRGVRRATLTDPSGGYSFTNLSPSSYTVQQFLPSEWTQTLPPSGEPYTIALTGGHRGGVDFGNRFSPPRTASISGFAFDDRNGNGRLDLPETGISGRRIELSGGGKLHATLTDEKGNYNFKDIVEGTYTLRQILPAGAVQTIPPDGQPYSIELAGDNKSGMDFGSRIVVSVEDLGEVPREYKLYQNFPNPFNPSTQLAFYIPKSGHVTLKVYNLLGVELATLVDGWVSTGTHAVVWDASDAPSGVYVYRLTAGSFAAVKKMVLMR